MTLDNVGNLVIAGNLIVNGSFIITKTIRLTDETHNITMSSTSSVILLDNIYTHVYLIQYMDNY